MVLFETCAHQNARSMSRKDHQRALVASRVIGKIPQEGGL